MQNVRRVLGQRISRGLMHPLAELAGVADVFTALNADRPHRLALSPRAIATELQQHGLRSLSHEAVAVVLDAWQAPARPPQPPVPLNLGGEISATGITRLARNPS